MGGFWGGFYTISQFVARLAYINLMWICFTLLGGIIFGFMPATVAVFTLIRKWRRDRDDLPVFRTFWQCYKKEFMKSNLLGLLLLLLGYLLYLNLTLLQTDVLVFAILRYVMLFFCILFMIMTLFLFQVYAHYNLKPLLYLKTALLIGLTYPHFVALMVLGIILLQYLLMLIPGIIPFFSVSLLAYMMTWIAEVVFKKLDNKEDTVKRNKEIVPT
jgi:uncharacterized membrane protein YesL